MCFAEQCSPKCVILAWIFESKVWLPDAMALWDALGTLMGALWAQRFLFELALEITFLKDVGVAMQELVGGP